MAAIIPIAVQLVPVAVQLIESATRVIAAARTDPAATEELKRQLDALDARLTDTMRAVAAVDVRQV